MSISLRIKELIKRDRMSQKDISTILIIDTSQFSKIVNGKLQPTLNQLMELSSIFKVSLDWICFGNKKEDDPPDSYKELAESRKETIDLLKGKVISLEKEIAILRSKNAYDASVQTGTVEFLNEPKLGEEVGK